MPKMNYWTEDELSYISNNYGLVGARAVGNAIGRSEVAVRHKASRLGIEPGDYRNRIAMSLRIQVSENDAHCLKSWKRLVKERDDNTCQSCGLHEPIIVTAHHITAVTDGGAKFDINNGITLCPNCHALEHAISKGHKSSGKRIDHEIYKRIQELLNLGLGVEEVASHVHTNGKTIQRIKDCAPKS